MSFGQLTCTVYNSNLTVNSTINEVISARGKRLKSRAGTGTATFPATATNVGNIEHGVILDVYMPSTIGGDLYAAVFIVDNIDTTERDGQETITASGPTLLHELTYRIIADAAINGRTGSAISQIMAFDSNWSYYIFAGLGDASEDVYLTCAGENVFEALRQAHEQSADDFVLFSARPPSRTIEWLRTSYGSGATLLEPTYATPVNEAIGEGPILDLKKKDTANQTVTRITAYGAGMGADRVTITNTPTVRRSALESAFTNFSFDWTNSVITNDALELTGQPIREQVRAWSYIKPKDDTDTDDVEDAATSLAYAAAKWLTDRDGSQVYYSVTTILHRDINPGMNIEVTYSGDKLSLSGDYIIHDLSHSVATDGIRKTVLTVSNSTAEESDDSRATVAALQSAASAANHTTAPPTGGGTTTPIDHDRLLGLLDDDHTQYLKADGSRNLTGDLLVASGKKIDGVDISVLDSDFDAHVVVYDAHAVDADAHHNWPLLDGDIPATLARDSEVTAAVAAHAAITNVHHNLVTVSGLGLGLANQLVTLSSSSDPGAAASILATDGAGLLTLDHLEITNNLVVLGDFTVGSNVLFVDESAGGVGINRTPDSQFDLDVLGNIRSGGYIVGQHAIQLDDAVLIAHFDGARPYKTDFSGNATGHMGQVPAITGPEVYRPGKFGKALQVAEATTNYIYNPACNAGLFGYSMQNSGGSTGVAASYSADCHTENASIQLNGGVVGSWPRLFATNGSTVDYIPVTAGETVTFSFYAKDLAGSSSLWGGITLGGSTVVLLPTSYPSTTEWTRYSIAYTVPSTGIAGAWIGTKTSGSDIIVDSFQFEKVGYPTPICYGDMPDHTWSGTAHASTSSRAANYLGYGGVRPDEGQSATIMAWANVGGDAHNQVFRCVGSTGLIYVRHYPGDHSIHYRFGYTERSYTPAASLRHEWHHYAVSYNADTNIMSLYIDGELVDSGSAGTSFVPNATGLFPGGDSGSGDFILNGWVDEFVFVGRLVSADEIRAIYESNAPVFAESSSWGFKLPNNLVWADEDGLFMVTEDGDAAFGMIGVDSKSWGGFTADAGDLVIGNTAGNSMYWDASEGTLELTGSLIAGDGNVVIDDDGVHLKATSSYYSNRSISLVDPSNSYSYENKLFSTVDSSDTTGYWKADAPTGKEAIINIQAAIPTKGAGIWIEALAAAGKVRAYGNLINLTANDIELVGDINLEGDVYLDSATYKLRRNGTHIEWYNGTSWVQLD